MAYLRTLFLPPPLEKVLGFCKTGTVFPLLPKRGTHWGVRRMFQSVRCVLGSILKSKPSSERVSITPQKGLCIFFGLNGRVALRNNAAF